jgi:hypothetical protein
MKKNRLHVFRPSARALLPVLLPVLFPVLLYIGFIYWMPLVRRRSGAIALVLMLAGSAVVGLLAVMRDVSPAHANSSPALKPGTYPLPNKHPPVSASHS